MEETKNMLAETAARELNSFSFNTKAFVATMGREHRTLQQSFTKLCFAWLRYVASDEYHYDGRNEASHLAAKAITDAGKDLLDPPLPMV